LFVTCKASCECRKQIWAKTDLHLAEHLGDSDRLEKDYNNFGKEEKDRKKDLFPTKIVNFVKIDFSKTSRGFRRL
jgi:hypothetical protein